MRHGMRLVLVALCILVPSAAAFAQDAGAQLVGRAVLPADYLTDGPQAGISLSKGAVINGIKVPFDTQPVGSISAILPGQYPGTWLALGSGQLGQSASSGDFLLRFYVFELSMRRAGSGGGDVTMLDGTILADPNARAGGIVNEGTSTRYLTGADFIPRAFQKAGGAYWVAESKGPSLLRFDAYGKLLEAPIPLEGAGDLQGMGILPDETALVIAQRDSGNRRRIVLRTFDLTTRTFDTLPTAYTLEQNGNSVSSLMMINSDQAVVIETDGGENAKAGFKRIFLINVRDGSGGKTLLIDLLNIADPNGISSDPVFNMPGDAFGLGDPFRFPFSAITSMYPSDEQTLIIANNNLLPYGLGRSKSQADSTEYIAVRLGQPLRLDAAFLRPLG